MNNEITIILTGDTALNYINNEKLKDENYDKLVADLNKITAERDNLQARLDELNNTRPTSHKVSIDTEMFDSLHKPSNSPFSNVKPKVPTVKLKSRLPKAAKEDLHDIAIKKVRGVCELNTFAAKWNVRPATVETYIKKHSKDAYKLVPGSFFKPKDIWTNAEISPNSFYITSKY